MSSSTQTPVIKTLHLTKRFKEITAANDVNITVEAGDVYGVLGPNGAGKTTIAMILGLTQATQGTVEVLGKPVTTEQNSALEEVGAIVGDGPAYISYFTGRQNVAHVAERFGIPDSEVDDVLKFLGLETAA